jgi:hypothetical protein
VVGEDAAEEEKVYADDKYLIVNELKIRRKYN